MALRQLDFDVEALGAIAAKACGASECHEIEVIGEGHPDCVPKVNKTCSIFSRYIQPCVSPRSRHWQ